MESNRFVNSTPGFDIENNEESKILDIDKIATEALMWAYKLTHWYEFNLVESVSDIDTTNLTFNDIKVEKIDTKIISKKRLKLQESSFEFVNESNRLQIMNTPIISEIIGTTISVMVQYGITIDSRFQWDVLLNRLSFVLRIEGSYSSKDLQITEKKQSIYISQQSVRTAPHSKRTVTVDFDLLETETSVYSHNLIVGNIKGVINLKLGKKINFTVDIGFAIYCLEIMNEAPVGVFASEDKKGMIFKGKVIVRDNAVSEVFINLGKIEFIE